MGRVELRELIYLILNMGKFAGNWKRVRSEGGAAFFLAFGAPQEKLEKAAKADLNTTVVSDGKTIKIKRTYSLGGVERVQHQGRRRRSLGDYRTFRPGSQGRS